MSFKPETSLMVGLATATVVFAVFQSSMPSVADVRSATPHNSSVDRSRKTATWTAAGAVAAISLMAQDPTVFTLGGAMVVVLDFSHRIANSQHGTTGKLVPAPAAGGPAVTPGS